VVANNMMQTIIYDFPIMEDWLLGKGTRQSTGEMLVVRMNLNELRTTGHIKLGDKIELKRIPPSSINIIAGIVLNSGYIPVLNGQLVEIPNSRKKKSSIKPKRKIVKKSKPKKK
jgi:hypothetical protein